jgi:hypothetical protein
VGAGYAAAPAYDATSLQPDQAAVNAIGQRIEHKMLASGDIPAYSASALTRTETLSNGRWPGGPR